VNKAELIEALSAHYDGSKTEAAKALNAVVQTITYKTAAGEKVSITGFGVFEKVHRDARMVRNPRTGERKRAKATAVPRFRAGTDLKAYVSGAKKVPRATKKAAAAAKTAVTRTPATTTAATKTAATKTAATKTAATKTAAPAKKTTTAKAAPVKKAAVKKAAATTAAKTTAPAKKTTTAKTATAQKSAAKKTTAKR
jgi:DNA-binding protein HU-beta